MGADDAASQVSQCERRRRHAEQSSQGESFERNVREARAVAYDVEGKDRDEACKEHHAHQLVVCTHLAERGLGLEQMWNRFAPQSPREEKAGNSTDFRADHRVESAVKRAEGGAGCEIQRQAGDRRDYDGGRHASDQQERPKWTGIVEPLRERCRGQITLIVEGQEPPPAGRDGRSK